MLTVCLVAVMSLLFQSAAAPKPAPKPPASAAKAAAAATDVAVTLSYKGKGTVDANHKVIAWLFSDPNITSGSRPVATQMTAKNGDVVVFKNVPATPVYVFTVFDEKGGYDGVSGPPPAGVPCATYRKLPKGPPTPVKAGDAVKFTFTDAERWNK